MDKKKLLTSLEDEDFKKEFLKSILHLNSSKLKSNVKVVQFEINFGYDQK